MKSDGTMARMPDLERFAEEHDIKMVTVEQLIAYRRRNEKLVVRRVEAGIPIGGAIAADVEALRLRRRPPPREPPRAGAGRDRFGAAGAAACALRVPDRRHLRQPALRLRRAAARRDGRDRRGGRRRRSSTSATRRAAASACSTSCTPTTCRTSGWTPSRPTRRSGIRRTSATTASAARSCTTSACARSGC